MSRKKQKVDDPTYAVVKWAVENKHDIMRQFFPEHNDKEPLECEMQYVIRQVVGGISWSSRNEGRFNKSKLGHVDLVIYSPLWTATWGKASGHPDERRRHVESSYTNSEWHQSKTLYIKVESEIPPMDKIMRELQDLSFYLERVPKERVALLAPPTELDVEIRSQGFGFIEFSPGIELNEEEPLSPRV